MRSRSNFVCQQCGYSQVSWAGKCPNCGTWNSLVETLIETSDKKRVTRKELVKPVPLSLIPSRMTSRILTKISELDRVLGGGLVLGQVVLIAGEPGIGKSTLLLQVAEKQESLYISGEESSHQIKIRADRLNIKGKNITIVEETDVDSIINQISNLKSLPRSGIPLSGKNLLVIDSIQTLFTQDLSGMSGSVGQVRECAFRLIKVSKQKNISLFIIGHVTKEGNVAGPAVLAHLVDTVLWFEGDKNSNLRILRAVKNRFGPTDEVGIFSMEEKGLISMSDPEKIFLTKIKRNVAGSVITVLLEGTRPILVEIQSLIIPTKFAMPRRVVQGIDPKRVEMLLAVLTRRLNLPIYESDVFVNVVGGIKTIDPGIDLAVALSVASSYFDKALVANLVALGEVGLLGEIRQVPSQEKRIKEAKRLGYKNVVSSKEIGYISEAVKKYLG